MRALQVCRSPGFGSQPRYFALTLLSQRLGRSTSPASPQFTPAPWPCHRLFHHHHSAVRFKQPRHASYSWGVALVACIVGSAAAIRLFYAVPGTEKPALLPQDDFNYIQSREYHHDFSEIIDTLKMSSKDIRPGHLGNLTKEQEAKLREMWTILFKLFGIKIENSQLEKSSTLNSSQAENPADAKKKSKRSFFGFGGGGGGGKQEGTTSQDSYVAALTTSDEDDKYGQNKEFAQAIADLTPEQLRESLWNMLKADHPDALLLRFLRARKWDVNRAVVMFISTMRWRLVEMHVDDEIVGGGEERAREMAQSSDPATKKLGEDFLAQIRMGKSFIHCVDKRGRPVCLVRVRLHRIGVHAEKSTEMFTVHIIETARLMLPYPVETAVIMFDMTGFTLANMDYSPVKFMIKCFEANYPESLGAVLVHQAPWIFSGIWKIIKGWLDPVVAAKVHFTNTTEDLEAFIDRSRILKEHGGDDDTEFTYIEASPDENSPMKDTAKRDEIIAKRAALAQEMQDATKAWIEASLNNDSEGVESWKAKREELAAKMSQAYWEADAYVRARSMYDRSGIIQSGGKISFYSPESSSEEEEEVEKTNGADAAEPAAAKTEEEKAEAPEVSAVVDATAAITVSAS